MTAVGGAPTRLNVRAFPRPLTKSGSAAVAVNLTGEPGAVASDAGTPPRVGAVFTSRTTAVTACAAVTIPSVARTWKTNVSGPCASVGVHEKSPLLGSMVAPSGAPAREYV